tara:strand:+ start:218 stop:499 length:282 start_codon:yes stop_codon:yes gene_type:complete
MEAKEFLCDKQNKSTKSLFKGFLVLLEDLYTEHQIHFKKLKQNAPEYEQLIAQADYFDRDKLQYYRKKVLDIGNESIRETNSDLEKFTINFKF